MDYEEFINVDINKLRGGEPMNVVSNPEKIKSDSQENFFGDEFETYDHILNVVA